MRIVPTPPPGDAHPDTPEQALERALDAAAGGAAAESWRELRGDVRALAAPISPEFERRLRALVVEHAASAPPPRSTTPASGPRRRWSWRRPRGGPVAGGTRRSPWRVLADSPVAASAVAATLCALIAAVVIAAPFSATPGRRVAAPLSRPPAAREAPAAQEAPAVQTSPQATPTVAVPVPPGGPTVSAGPSISSGTVESAPAAPATGRVQQLGASITLAAAPSAVQALADGVSRLASGAGGYVASSQVQVQGGSGEATLQLSIPSARLASTLAALARLAPVRAQSQSLQDITSTYEAAHRALADAVAARGALLRALARASTQGEIESLRRRLSLAGGAIERARSNLQAISRQAASSTVEVTVVGDSSAGREGLTLNRGLHDAGGVLTGALVIGLIALAVLAPLALVLAAVIAAARTWRRTRREHALDAR